MFKMETSSLLRNVEEASISVIIVHSYDNLARKIEQHANQLSELIFWHIYKWIRFFTHRYSSYTDILMHTIEDIYGQSSLLYFELVYCSSLQSSSFNCWSSYSYQHKCYLKQLLIFVNVVVYL